MSKHVIILGGGVAGMSAAHELIERGFHVTVYEHKPVPGGKARSIPIPSSGTDGRKDLPGEHGFRFFPRFYKHLPDTMSRIPYGSGWCVDNLVETTRIEMAQYGLPPVLAVSRFPRTFDDLKVILKGFMSSHTGLTLDDCEFFGGKLWQILTSCQERRIAEYELINWWKFIDADNRSAAYQKFFGHGISRSLVAAKADKASARTMGDITLQMFLDIAEPGISSDRLLNGPTDDVWILPWLNYLQSRGVEYIMNAQVNGINCDGTRITGVAIEQNGVTSTITGDYYLCAMPIERIAPLINAQILRGDPALVSLPVLAKNVEWMNGIQFYLKQDEPIDHGHTIYIDSEWALTSVSQAQFWTGVKLADYGDGKVNGILSVDISDWTTNGMNHVPANQCTRAEVARQVWEQLKTSLNVDGQQILSDADLVRWFLDPDIIAANNNTGIIEDNLEPLLVNLIDTWKLRPQASTQIPNLFLASDYVQTNTDLATMEGANEAARRAVNGIIGASGSKATPCKIWPLHEPDILWPWREHDQSRFKKGLPWDGKIIG
ncbi:MAG: FAD-dependent oxidoreductase [Flavobacteriales bacterium]|nr:FAD-dependent oxidoreductase [Flavobacteriales bacterium]